MKEQIIKIKQFKSKKGQASLCTYNGIICVCKEYKAEASMKRELHLYELLQGSNVPISKLLKVYNHNTLLLSYLDGCTALDSFVKWENVNNTIKSKILADKIAQWLILFYTTTFQITGKNLVLNDIHLRNFMSLDYNVIGIDFEEWSYGEIERDIAIFCTYINNYYPSGTEFKKIFIYYFLNIIYKKLNLSESKVKLFTKEAMETLKKRRAMNIQNKSK